MAHDHGNEYRIRIIRQNGTEELGVWMNSTEQVVQTMLAIQDSQGNSYWLLVRKILCPNCVSGQQIVEYPIAHIPSPRFIPHDSRYLQVVESRNVYTWNPHS